jgi:5-(carboxyamino)imidazole ribonucleotide mutase
MASRTRETKLTPGPKVAVIMGSASDWETMRHAVETLERFGVSCERKVVSAHRTPELMVEFAKEARARGLELIIAGAGGAAHLPGMVASLTSLPVLGVPVQSKALSGVDSLLSIVQMPGGVPTATFSIGPAGATNAALFAVRLLALRDVELHKRLEAFRVENAEKAKASTADLVLPSEGAPKRKVRR